MTVAVFTPACVSADELAAWEAAQPGTLALRAERPCEDCLLAFALEMRAIGRCNGQPGGAEEEPEMEPESKSTPMMIRITTVAPCETCVHARVCRLRPSAELVVRAEVPALDSALGVSLTATCECSEYARVRPPGRPAGKPLSGAELAARTESLAKARTAKAAKKAAATA